MVCRLKLRDDNLRAIRCADFRCVVVVVTLGGMDWMVGDVGGVRILYLMKSLWKSVSDTKTTIAPRMNAMVVGVPSPRFGRSEAGDVLSLIVIDRIPRFRILIRRCCLFGRRVCLLIRFVNLNGHGYLPLL